MQDNSAKTPQLKEWTSRFGDNYANRNEFADWKLPLGIEAFSKMLSGREPESILEVGSNIGLNMIFLNKLLKEKTRLYAVEPNKKAFDKLTSHPMINLSDAWNCDAFQIPLQDNEIDLVFTAGVLIHIAPEDLGCATDEIVRIAKNYVLCVEYFSHTPEEIPYHEQDGLLYKRDFGSFYMDRYPNLECISYGFLWEKELSIFDNLNWWLFKKN